MKKFYEPAEMSIILFSACDTIVASGTTPSDPSRENDETEIL